MSAMDDGTGNCSQGLPADCPGVPDATDGAPRCRWPAPTPDWPVAIDQWGWLWPLHIYAFPVLYLGLVVYICVWFATSGRGSSSSSLSAAAAGRRADGTGPREARPPRRRGKLRAPRLSASLHGLVLVSCLSRCLFMFVDPYGTRRLLPCPLGPVLWSCGWPFIVASVSVLLLALLETTRMTLAPPRFQRPAVLAAFIVPSLAFVLVTDFLVAYDSSAAPALLVCQALFVLWGALLGAGFLAAAWKMRPLVANSQGRRAGSPEAGAREDARLRRLLAVVLSCALVGLALTGTNLYAAVSLYAVALRAGYTSPGRWLAFQTCQRLLEVSLVLLLVTAVRGTGTGTARSGSGKAVSPVKTADDVACTPVANSPDAKGDLCPV